MAFKLQTNIPAGKRPRVAAAMVGLYPVPLIPNPMPTEDEPTIPEFTDDEWIEEILFRNIKRDVRRWEQKVASDAAKQAVDISGLD